MIDDLKNRMDGTGFRVRRPIHEAAQAGMQRRTRAHGAWLDCSKEFAIAEPVVTEGESSLSEGYDFSVRGGVMIRQISIPSPSYDATGAHHDRAHRHLTSLQGALRASQGFFHPQFVGGETRVGGSHSCGRWLGHGKQGVEGEAGWGELPTTYGRRGTAPHFSGAGRARAWEVYCLSEVLPFRTGGGNRRSGVHFVVAQYCKLFAYIDLERFIEL